LALEGVKKISIANRTPSRAIQLASDISKKTEVEIQGMGLDDKELPKAISESLLLVNTTSAGMNLEHPLLINEDWLHRQLVVYDIIYNPPETQLMKAAKEKGLKTIGGIGMLVHQGAIAFNLWTGQYPPVDTMRLALMEALGL